MPRRKARDASGAAGPERYSAASFFLASGNASGRSMPFA
jgi:hypothetical protein